MVVTVMTDNQRKAYEWAKEHSDYSSKGARCAHELVGLVDELMAAGAKPVVQCKDCKCGKIPDMTIQADKYRLCGLYSSLPIMRIDDFCSYGEKRKGGDGKC